MTQSAYQNKQGEWVYPQIWYRDGKRIPKKRLLEQIHGNPLVKEAIWVEPRIKHLIEKASQQRCELGYNLLHTFYGYYKPQITALVGWESPHAKIRTTQHYDAVYEAIYDLLPSDDVDLYPDGIMPNGMYSPNLQEKYHCDYP